MRKIVCPHQTAAYETWAPVIGRFIFAFIFLFAAWGKIPGTSMFWTEVAYSVHAGVPVATAAVSLAFILEVAGGIALLLGWYTRLAAFVLAPYILLLGVIFYHNLSDPLTMGLFICHLGYIAGLLYISVYGARHAAVGKD